MSVYQMGQYRFQGSGCLVDLSDQVEPCEWKTTTTGGKFTDFALQLDGGFKKGQDYYLQVDMPGDINYDIKFNLKLVKDMQDAFHTSVFQWIDAAEIPKDEEAADAELVVMFEAPFDNNKTIKAAIPIEYIEGRAVEAYTLYTKDGEYYYGVTMEGSNTLVKVENYSDMLMIPTWLDSLDIEKEPSAIFDTTFRPVEDFTHAVLEIERTGDDWNIMNDDGEYGRTIDPSKVSFKCYKINDLVDKMSSGMPLSHIGVWGKPGLLMTVNGEPIRIGPRGFYEQDSIPITSIGVIAQNYATDMFTIDYKYQTE